MDDKRYVCPFQALNKKNATRFKIAQFLLIRLFCSEIMSQKLLLNCLISKNKFYGQQNLIMSNDCVNNFQMRKSVKRWTYEEQLVLNQIVNQISPKNKNDWKKVQEQMQSLRYNRTLRAYKQKVQNLIKNQKNFYIHWNRSVIQNMINLFSEGKSTKLMTKIFSKCQINTLWVRKFLASKFKTIKKVLTKILGNTQAQGLNLKDYQLFQFAKSQNILNFDLLYVVDLADRWNELQKGKYKTDKTLIALCQIQKSLLDFNHNLKQLKLKYQAHKHQKHIKSINEKIETSQKIIEERFKYQLMLHSMQMSQIIYQIEDNILSGENCNVIGSAQIIDSHQDYENFIQSSFKNNQYRSDNISLTDFYNPEDISIFFEQQRFIQFSNI